MKPEEDDEQAREVLVVEDDPWIRALLTDLLAAEGFEVEQASNGPSAIRLANEQHPDLVLLDLAMPEMSGTQVLRKLKADHDTDKVPVIVVSAYTRHLGSDDARLADGIIEKPFDLEDLLAWVKRLTHGERPPSSARPTLGY
ncbi:MAG TPA: response regulator [Chloroflexota bacterium]|nr:response regulator [Chloroflexota bacterium]